MINNIYIMNNINNINDINNSYIMNNISNINYVLVWMTSLR